MQRFSYALTALFVASAAFASERPNILVIVTDDQSPYTLSCYGNNLCDTPNLDRLAAAGMVLDQAYHMGSMSGAVCSPSRTMIMSGRTLWHLPPRGKKHLQGEEGVADGQDIPNNTIPAVFNRAGYDTFRTCKIGNSYGLANALFSTVRDRSCRNAGEEDGSQWHGKQVLDFLEARAESGKEEPEDSPRSTLSDAVAGRFDIGVGIGLKAIQTPENHPLLLKHFNYVTAENCMKFAKTQPEEGEFDFDSADRYIQFAQDHDLKVLGHCLIWAKDDRTPEWFYRDGDEEVSPEMLMQRMKTHIRTVVERYKGRVHSWDVVNEALGSGKEEYLRKSVWSKLLDDKFIIEAFRYTHQLDPDAILIYNDYHCHQPDRRAKMERLIERIRQENAPLNAIGIQGHYNLDDVPYEQLEELLILLRKLKLKIAISELDIDMIPRNGWWANGGKDRDTLSQYNPYPDACPPELLARQAEQYAKLFDLFQKYEDVILRVTFWNLHDGESWLNYFPWKRVNYPTLFDRARQPKPAFLAVIRSLSGSSN